MNELNNMAAVDEPHQGNSDDENEEVNQPNVENAMNNEEHFPVDDVPFLLENVNPDAGPGGEFENVIVERRRRRRFVYRFNPEQLQGLPAGDNFDEGEQVAPRGNNALLEQEQVADPAPRQRGRPRRNREPDVEVREEEEVVPARRPRGRPRRNREADQGAQEEQIVPVQRPRGRPRRNPEAQQQRQEAAPAARPRGRPRRHPPIVLPDIPEEIAEEEAEEAENDILGDVQDQPVNPQAHREDPVGDHIDIPIHNDVEIPVRQERQLDQIQMEVEIEQGAAAMNHEQHQDNIEVIDLVVEEVPGVLAPENQEPLARRPRTDCPICGSKRNIQKLRPCGHRYCTPCIRHNFMQRNCPQCRRRIESYLPPHLMGGEAWLLNVGQQLDNEFYEQAARERQQAYDRGEI